MLDDDGVAFVVVSAKVIGGGFAAQVAIDAGRIYIELTGNIAFVFVVYISHIDDELSGERFYKFSICSTLAIFFCCRGGKYERMFVPGHPFPDVCTRLPPMKSSFPSSQDSDQNHQKTGFFPVWGGLLLSLVSGALMFASFPPLDQGVLIWVSLIPLLIPLWSGRPRKAWNGLIVYALYGWIFGLVFFGGSLWWINEVSTLGYVFLVIFLSLYPALWTALMGTILRPAFRQEPPAVAVSWKERKAKWAQWCGIDMKVTVKAAMMGAALWVCMEWLRGWVFTGFGWNGMGVALYNGLSFAQMAEYVGVTALSFIPAMVNIWLWCIGRRLGIMVLREGRRTVPWDFFAMTLFLVIVFLWGMMLANAYAPGQKNERVLPVLAVQRNLTQQYKWNPKNREAIYLEMAEATRDACLELQENSLRKADICETVQLEQPTWIIWPESSLPTSSNFSRETGDLVVPGQYNEWFFNSDSLMGQVRKEVPMDFILLTGADEAYWDKNLEKAEMYNTLMVLESDFDSRKTYRKIHLVPFGEYIPFRKELPVLEKAFEFSAGTPMGSNFTSGESTDPLSLPIVPGSLVHVQAIPTICFEDTVGRLVRLFARPESQVIVNVTNDGWFNHSWANEQHWRNAAFRSIELRRSMVRAANTGVSVALAPNGAVIADIRDADGSPFLKGYMYARLPITFTGMTLYALLGDWAVVLCGLSILILLLRYWRHGNRPNSENREKPVIKDGKFVRSPAASGK